MQQAISFDFPFENKNTKVSFNSAHNVKINKSTYIYNSATILHYKNCFLYKDTDIIMHADCILRYTQIH